MEEFSQQNLRYLEYIARISKELYKRKCPLEDCHVIDINEEFVIDDIRFGILEKKDCSFVVLRGSHSPENWRANLDYHFNNAGIHRGIANLERIVRRSVTRFLPRNKPIYMGGHSLGGAIAILCAFWLNHKNFEIKNVYTFGSPRFVNGETAQLINEQIGDRIFRFVNGKDLIPTIPFWLQGFRHVGNEIWMNGDKIIMNPTPIDYIWNFRHLFFPIFKTIKYHDMKGYYRAIQNS